MGDDTQSDVLTCEQCGQVDGVSATYNCMHCDTHENMGPQPEGIPRTRPCPGCGQDMKPENIKCSHCAEPGD
jgi:hypothetical protein